MSETQNQQPVQCFNPACKQQFTVVLPAAEIVNQVTVSMIVWAHPDVQTCPHCGTPYQMRVMKLKGLEVGWAPVRPSKEGAGAIVVPPPGFQLPKPS